MPGPVNVDKREVWPWIAAPVPEGLPVLQAAGWLFAPDGRVLLVRGPEGGFALPGGGVEPEDADGLAALVREAAEEANAVLGAVAYVGYRHDVDSSRFAGVTCARGRWAARLSSLGPAMTDPAERFVWDRVLVPPLHAADLMGRLLNRPDSGQTAAEAEAARRCAHERLGVPLAEGTTMTELPAEGVVFDAPHTGTPRPGNPGSR